MVLAVVKRDTHEEFVGPHWLITTNGQLLQTVHHSLHFASKFSSRSRQSHVLVHRPLVRRWPLVREFDGATRREDTASNAAGLQLSPAKSYKAPR
jgi:hypothetical protein